MNSTHYKDMYVCITSACFCCFKIHSGMAEKSQVNKPERGSHLLARAPKPSETRVLDGNGHPSKY